MQKFIALLFAFLISTPVFAQGFGSPNGVGFPTNGSSGGSGTVTTFSASPSSVFDVANATTTPALSLDAQSGNKFLASPANGSSAAPTFRILDVADFPVLTTAQGGTGLSSYTAGDTLYYASGTLLSKLAKGTAGQFYQMNSGATAPQWSSFSGDATVAAGGAVTLATVNSNVGSFTNSSITVNAKGLVTAASSGAAGLTNPMTTTGDIIYSSDGSGTPARLARGTIGQRLEMGPSNLLLYSNQSAASPTVRTPKLRKYGATFFSGTTYKNYGWSGSNGTGGAGASSTPDVSSSGAGVTHATGTTPNFYNSTQWAEGYGTIVNPRYWFRVGLKSTTLANKSIYAGVTSNFALMMGSDSLANQNYIVIRRQGATDTNYQLAYCNGSTLTVVDTGIAAALNDDHTWCLECTATQYNVYCDGVFCCNSGANLPSSSSALFPFVGVATRTGAAADMNIYGASVEYD